MRFQCVGCTRAGGTTWDHVQLNHYLTKSKEDFAAKVNRTSASGLHRRWREFEQVDEVSTDTCTDAAEKYGPYP